MKLWHPVTGSFVKTLPIHLAMPTKPAASTSFYTKNKM
jgi:hypothetical protein